MPVQGGLYMVPWDDLEAGAEGLRLSACAKGGLPQGPNKKVGKAETMG
jgi:hypothetical protein